MTFWGNCRFWGNCNVLGKMSHFGMLCHLDCYVDLMRLLGSTVHFGGYLITPSFLPRSSFPSCSSFHPARPTQNFNPLKTLSSKTKSYIFPLSTSNQSLIFDLYLNEQQSHLFPTKSFIFSQIHQMLLRCQY